MEPTQVEPVFQDFHGLVRFTHLEEASRNATWVRVDGDEVGEHIVNRLRGQYTSWRPDRFGTFFEPNFEAHQIEAKLTSSRS